jgi:small subunit ribosomal protein S20
LPHHKSCKKRLKTSEKERLVNRRVKGLVRNAVKAVIAAETYEDATAGLSNAYAKLDKAVGKSVMHKNAAARKKASLSAHVAKLRG